MILYKLRKSNFYYPLNDLKDKFSDKLRENISNDSLNPLNANVALNIETSQLICTANQLSGFYMRATLSFNGLNLLKRQSLTN